MHMIDIEEAKRALPELLEAAIRGQEVILTKDDQPVAKLVALAPPRPRPRFGSARGLVRVAADFDAPLADFDDYAR